MIFKRTVRIFLAVGGALMLANAQVKERGSVLEKGVEQLLVPGQLPKESLMERAGAVPMEGAIDPAKYVIGPSDALELGIWGPLAFTYALTVTPEGTLIIPTVGEVRVADDRLADAKRKIVEAVKKKYPVGDITVTLMRPRSFVVTLTGAVLKQGQYVASAVDRVEKILLQGANVDALRPTLSIPSNIPPVNIPPGKEPDYVQIPRVAQADEIYDRASTRNILLFRRNGDTLRVDIPRYYATGESRYNPFLLDGDVIFVPQRNLSHNFVTVEGVVNVPGRYEYVKGDSLLSVLAVAQGIRTGIELQSISIFRLDARGEHFQVTSIDFNDGQEKEYRNLPIEQGDRIVVRARPDQRRNLSVTVSGEARSPGVFPITKSTTRLSEVIRRAGGFTDHALLSGSIILRMQERVGGIDDPEVNLLRSLRASVTAPADSVVFGLDIKMGRQPVVVSFRDLFERNDSTQDVIVRDKDIIYIASNQKTVLVQGQVGSPGYVAYVPGMRYDYYIAKAGGYSELAIEGDTRVIKNGTFEWVEPGKTTIEAGDQIWVPKQTRKTFGYYFEILRDIASIAAALTTTVLLAIRITE